MGQNKETGNAGEKAAMSVKEMWEYLIFQTKGYRVIRAVIVFGALSAAAAVYVNSILYAQILDALLENQAGRAGSLCFLMVAVVFCVEVISKACDQIFEHYIIPSEDETKKRTARKAFTMEYEEIEKKEVLSDFRRTRAGETGHGGIVRQLRDIYSFFKELVKIVCAVVFVAFLFASTNLEKENLVQTILLTALLIVLFVGTIVLNRRLSDYLGRKSYQMNLENEKINSLGQYVLGSILASEQKAKDVRLYRMQEYILRKCEAFVACGKNFSAYGRTQGKVGAALAFSAQLLAGFIYVYIALKATAGSVSTGQVLMYAGAIITMMKSVQTIFASYSDITYSNEYLKMYEQFIHRPNMHYAGTLPIEKRTDQRYELAFSRVSFCYPDTDNEILKDFSLKFRIGEKVALVGRNGAGKTTIIKLLLRLYEPTRGKILLNGIDIGKYDYEEYVKIFSVVFQDFQLYDFPLDENIAGSEQADEARVRSVLEQVGMIKRVQAMKEGIHTLLYHETGEGEALSGGEAQKVAIARAIYKDAPFVILDEPTAALDPIAEASVYENFNVLVGGKTAIYISHRMSSCKFCDRIVVIGEGGILEEGTHEELMEKQGAYAGLYETQAQYYQESCHRN